MPKTVSPILIANNSETFTTLVAKANTVIDHLATSVVTTGLTANGDATTGNAFVVGILGATTVAASTIRAGNVQTNGDVITIGSNVEFAEDKHLITNEAFVGNSRFFATTSNTSNTSANQIMGAFPVATWRGGKFVASVKDNSANSYYITEILVLQDGGNALVTEYASITSNATFCTFSANVSGGNLNLLYSPTSANTKVTIQGTLIKV